MKLNWLNLRFEESADKLEQRFQDKYFHSNIKHVRSCHFYTIAFYAAAGYIDYLFFTKNLFWLFFIRFLIVVPIFIIGYFFTFSRLYEKKWQLISLFYILLTGGSFIVFMAIGDPPKAYDYYAGIIFCMVFGYTFIRERFIYASVAGLILLTTFFLVSIFIIDLPKYNLTVSTFYLVLLNFLGMIISRHSEISARKDFHLEYMLSREKEKIVALNNTLDEKIKERTKSLIDANKTLKNEIIDRERIEKKLRETQNTFEVLFNEAPDAIFIESMDDRILDANLAASEMLGYTSDEFKQMTVLELQAPENRLSQTGIIKKELNMGGLFEGVDLHKNGTRIPVEINNHRTIIDDQEIVLSIVRDITDRKMYEKELKEREKSYREYFEDDLSGTYISKPNGQLVACNQEYKRIFGFETTLHAMETPISRLYQNEEDRLAFLNSIKEQKQIKNHHIKLVRVNGTSIHILENASGVFDEEGNLEMIRGFLMDVSEQKQLEAKLLQAQKMEAIGTLAGGIAHDFNNILSGLFGYSQLAKIHINEPKKIQKYILQIDKASQRAAELVKQILTFSRQSEYQKSPFNVSVAINEAIQLLRSSIPSTIEIKKKIYSKADVMADPIKIQQLIINLVTNAYHAIGNSVGSIEISLTEITISKSKKLGDETILPGQFLLLKVSDTGIGMDEKTLEKAFDPFFTTKPIGQGTGLGLALVQAIVKEHGGFIEVNSKTGQGTIFYIFLPVHKKNPKVGKLINDDSLDVQGCESIMIVDDEEAIRDISKKLLENHGYKVSTAENGIDALEKFEKNSNRIDLVVTDMSMPQMAGDKLSIELIKNYPDIPIILTTGYSESISEEKASSIGIRRLLFKPVEMRVLAKTIREVLDEK